MQKHVGRCVGLLFLLACWAGLSSCLFAEERDQVIYDAPRDEFRMLMVLRDIRPTSPSDLPHLEAIWRNRDHLIAPILPGTAAIPFPLPWFLRADNHDFLQFCFHSDSLPGEVDDEPASTKVALDAIKIAPGTFFMDDEKVCYFHAMTLPGSALDECLKEADIHSLWPTLESNGVDDELTRRKLKGAATHTWAEFKAQELAALDSEDKRYLMSTFSSDSVTDQHPIKPLMVLEETSLRALSARGNADELRPQRKGAILNLEVPLSAKDRDGILNVWAAWTLKVQAQAAAGKTGAWMACELALSKAWAVAPAASGIQLHVDLVNLYNDVATAIPASPQDIMKPADPPTKGPAATLPAKRFEDSLPPRAQVRKYLEDHGVVMEPLTFDQIQNDFAGGTLKAYPPAVSVKPGENMFPTPPPDTQPRPAFVPQELPPPPPQKGPAYTVVKGDTVTAIARRFTVTISAIVAANPGMNADRLRIGQALNLPPNATTKPPAQH